MRCIVTAGPTYEPLDDVRRLTNFSTGRLGSELVNYLATRGYEVTLLIGQQATYRGERNTAQVETFSTTANLSDRLCELSRQDFGAVFHAAAVSDFSFGAVFARTATGELVPIQSGKYSTRQGTLLAELVPTPKIISHLREWFPQALLVGWKFEVDGDRGQAIALGRRQVLENRTSACVVNGAAYGPGFGIVSSQDEVSHQPDASTLFEALAEMLKRHA